MNPQNNQRKIVQRNNKYINTIPIHYDMYGNSVYPAQPATPQNAGNMVYNRGYRQVPQRIFKPAPQNTIIAQKPLEMDTKSMNNYEYLEYMYPKDLTVKFNDNFIDVDSPRVSEMAPGWLEPTTDDFFSEIVDEPIMLKEGRIQKMTAQAHDIDQFDINPVFDVERDPNKTSSTYNQSKGLTTIETEPEFVRKQLLAISMNYMTYIKKTYLLANIKREGFHSWFYKMMGDKAGNAWMSTGLYGRTDKSPVLKANGAGTAYGALDGVLKQAFDISQSYQAGTTKYAGFAKMGYRDNVSDAIDNAILQYSDQQGASKNAKLILPSNVRMRLAIEIKNNRDSDFASSVYMKGGSAMATVYNKPILENEELEKVRNGWNNDIYFKNGLPVPDNTSGSTKGKNVVYGYYGDPKNIVWGMLKEAELESSYQHPKLAYLVSVNLAGDVKINYDKNTIVIPFDLGSTDPTTSESGK